MSDGSVSAAFDNGRGLRVDIYIDVPVGDEVEIKNSTGERVAVYDEMDGALLRAANHVALILASVASVAQFENKEKADDE